MTYYSQRGWTPFFTNVWAVAFDFDGLQADNYLIIELEGLHMNNVSNVLLKSYG